MEKLKKREEIALHKELRNGFKFDKLQMLLCKDYVSKNGITIRQPRLGEIINVGEEEFYRSLNVWITNPTAYRVSLWHMNIDWCKITDYELFCSLYKTVDQKIMSMVMPSVDISTFDQRFRIIDEENYEQVLYSEQLDMVIDKMTYLEISQYLRTMFNIFPKDELAKGKVTKEMIIWEDEMNAARKKDQNYQSTLFPLISSCVNHPGFKYRIEEIENVGIFYFMDAVSRLQVYENTRALLAGSMSGFCDTSKVPKDNFNFMRDYTVDIGKHEFTQKEKESFQKLQTR